MEIAYLKEQNERLISMTSNVPGMIYQFMKRPDKTSAFLFVSESSRDIYELTPEELYADGSVIHDIIHPDDHAMVILTIKKSIQEISHWFHEYRVKFPDGRVRWLQGSSMPKKMSDGSILWNGYITDITNQKNDQEERNRLEKMFQESQRRESLGILAGGIAHDFNNILAVISGCSHFLQKTDNSHHLELIDKSVARAADLCKQMLNYARKSDMVKDFFDVNLLLKDTVQMFQEIKKGIRVRLCLNDSTRELFGDSSQIQQVLMNVIINATEAVEGNNGEVLVSLDEIMCSSKQSFMDYAGGIIIPGRYLCVTVEDNGYGMTREAQDRIFEPFYTTKFTGRGLGMAAILGIVREHNGAIQFESQIGIGTIFRIYLPLLLTDIKNISKNSELIGEVAVEINYQRRNIIFADDENDLRMLGVALLTAAGFNVAEAENGKRALEIFSQSDVEISLVILDMTMPVMNGKDAFHALRKIAENVPVIFCSGNAIMDIGLSFENDKNTYLVQKPYLPRKLVSLVNEILR